MPTVIDGSTGIQTQAIDVVTPITIADGGTALSAAGTTKNVLVSDGTNWSSSTLPLHLSTPVATTSGGSFDFTGIPSWAKRITLLMSDITNATTTNYSLTFNNVVTATYTYTLSRNNASGSSSQSTAVGTNFRWLTENITLQSGVYHIYLTNPATYTYIIQGAFRAGTSYHLLTGHIALGSALSSIQMAGGTFSAGEVNFIYE